MVVQRDVEIYVRHCPNERVLEWLTSVLGEVVLVDQFQHMAFYQYRTQGGEFPINLFRDAADGTYTSVSIVSPHLPWRNDVECAREAARALGCEVRCDPMAIHPTAGPGEFLRILDGHEEYVNWDAELEDGEQP